MENLQNSTDKTCRTCQEQKPLTEYYITSGKYHTLDCKECTKAKQREKNKLITREQKDANNEKAREKYAKTKDEVNAIRREKHQKNKDDHNKYQREYYQKYKSEINPKRYEIETNPREKIRRSLQTSLRRILRGGSSKFSLKYFGCSSVFLRKWLLYQLDDDMTLENYSVYWTIDHLKPCAQYDLLDEDQVKQCFYWVNIRPLLATQNWEKNSHYDDSPIMDQYNKAIQFQELYSTITPYTEETEDGLKPILAHFFVPGKRQVERKTTNTALGKEKRPFKPKSPHRISIAVNRETEKVDTP